MSTHDTRHDYPVADRVDTGAILEPAPAAPEPVPTPVPVPAVAAEEPPADPEAAWRDLQLRFVEDPRSAVAAAADLVEQSVADLRRRMESTDATEELRSAFLRCRELHQRLR